MIAKILLFITSLNLLLNPNSYETTRNSLVRDCIRIENNWYNNTEYEDFQLEHAGIWEYINENNYTLDYVYNLEGQRMIQWVTVSNNDVEITVSLDDKDYTLDEFLELYPGLKQ